MLGPNVVGTYAELRRIGDAAAVSDIEVVAVPWAVDDHTLAIDDVLPRVRPSDRVHYLAILERGGTVRAARIDRSIVAVTDAEHEDVQPVLDQEKTLLTRRELGSTAQDVLAFTPRLGHRLSLGRARSVPPHYGT